MVEGRVGPRRTAEDGSEWWEAAIPRLVTVNSGCNKPRAPTLSGKIRVKRGGVIVHWSCADVGIDPNKVGLKNSPTIVAKVDTVHLPPRARKLFHGEPRVAVAELLRALVKDGVVRL